MTDGQHQGQRSYRRSVTLAACMFLAALACAAQDRPFKPATPAPANPQANPQPTPQPRPQPRPQAKPPENPLQEELKKYPGLMEEFGRLMGRLQRNIQMPPARSQSRLLPLLPGATVYYSAFANYGEVARQALLTFRQGLQESAVLRDWYRHGDVGVTGPKIEDAVEKFAQLSQYLGDEIVITGAVEGKDPALLVVAEARKPGLKEVLQPMIRELAGKSKPGIRVLDLQELAAAAESRPPAQELFVLVRPDLVVAASSLATLRSFNARLDRGAREFASTPFGQRVAQAYEGGVASVGAADLQTILKLLPPGPPQSQATFQRSGFADMKYLIWEARSTPGQQASEGELSFTSPRHGAASWLASPSPLDSLDFVSPDAMLVSSLHLKDPARIFDEAQELSSTPNAFAGVAQMEQGLHLSLKDDLLRYLTGEITFELDRFSPPASPAWKAVLRVSDPARLQQTLRTILEQMHFQLQPFYDDGVTYYTVMVPSRPDPLQIGYAFVDGYLVVASSPGAIGDAVRLHRSGGSLEKSEKLKSALPLGHPSGASALIYQDPVAFVAMNMARMSPELAKSLGQQTTAAGNVPGTVIGLYGEPDAIRVASKTSGLNAGMVMVAAAIVIPNLLRARIAANESSAVGKVRTVNTAQVVYETTYPQRGFAPDLASLGPGPGGATAPSPSHAGLLDETLAAATCTGEAWCESSGFRFRLAPICKLRPCRQYLIVATPVSNSTGQKSFCSTSDGIIRFTSDPDPALPATVLQCRKWPPLQ